MAYDSYSLSDPALLDMMRDGRRSVAGITVGERSALRNSTFYRALALISGSMSMLPLHLMRRLPSGQTEKAKDHPLFNVLHRKANGFQTAGQFKSYMQTAALLDGNAYALKVKSRGAVRQLIPLPRRRVKPKLSSTFDLTFEYQPANGAATTLQQDDIFHFRSPITLDGLKGVGLLDVCADTLGISARAQEAIGRLFDKGTIVRGALETDKTLGDVAIKNLKQSLMEEYSGSGAEHDWLILEEGLKAKAIGSNAKDSQLKELMQGEREEIARFSGVPRPLLMFDETSWGSGIEQLGLFFVTYCLMTWFVIWEEAVWMCCLTPAEQETMYAKYNERALLRGSMKDQAEFLARALGSGGGQPWFTQDEARETFDMNPAGDDLPRAGTTAAQIATED
jgi:HK97 family phage portal protein